MKNKPMRSRRNGHASLSGNQPMTREAAASLNAHDAKVLRDINHEGVRKCKGILLNRMFENSPSAPDFKDADYYFYYVRDMAPGEFPVGDGVVVVNFKGADFLKVPITMSDFAGPRENAEGDG